MSDVRAIFFDVGGVLLTNGWDRFSRREACRHFDLDWEDIQDRHEFVADAFERGFRVGHLPLRHVGQRELCERSGDLGFPVR